MTIEIFDANLFVPTTLHDARYAHGVVSVALVDLHQSRLRMPGVNADDGQPHLIQLGPQPCRLCSGLEPNPKDGWCVQFDECRDRLRVLIARFLSGSQSCADGGYSSSRPSRAPRFDPCRAAPARRAGFDRGHTASSGSLDGSTCRSSQQTSAMRGKAEMPWTSPNRRD